MLTNPLRVLDTKAAGDLALFTTLPPQPRMVDHLDPEDAEHWAAVRAGLDAIGIAYEVDHGLVRGLDYYTRTAFEVHDRNLGAQSALGGGGRYDGLIEELGGPATPGVGFSIGQDRSMLVLEERGLSVENPPVVLVVAMDSTRAAAQKLARDLRQEFTVDIDLEGRGFGAQMKSAGKSGARFLVILGEDEWQRGEVLLKDSQAGTQETLAPQALAASLRAKVSA